jgi:hypothetical protein
LGIEGEIAGEKQELKEGERGLEAEELLGETAEETVPSRIIGRQGPIRD